MDGFASGTYLLRNLIFTLRILIVLSSSLIISPFFHINNTVDMVTYIELILTVISQIYCRFILNFKRLLCFSRPLSVHV